MVELLVKNPLLLLFLVAAVGYPLGHIKFRGGSLGVAAVLFVGLLVGALHPDLKLPELIYLFGLTLFVYSIGLSSGPTFFASFRRRGITETAMAVFVLCAAAAVTVLIKMIFHMKPETATGMFAGALNNTPALAAILDQLKSSDASDSILNLPVVAYSIAYPLGVLGTILAISVFQKVWKIDYQKEQGREERSHAMTGRISHRTIRVDHPAAMGRDLAQVRSEQKWPIVFGRVKRGGRQDLIDSSTRLEMGDEITIVGPESILDEVVKYFGELAPEDLSKDRSEFDYRRIFVSNQQVAGRSISDLKFLENNEATITRIRRGDVEILAAENTVLEPGDRIRVLCRRNRMDAVNRFFGDSYKAVSEIDILSFSLGLTLGILVGLVPVPIGPGITLKLGFAGGPLIVGLILGRLHRTGPILWVLPFSSTMMLRQIGLVMFLAGVGTRAGYAFFSTLTQGTGIVILLSGLFVTFTCVGLALWLGYRWLKIPMGRLIGIVAGLQTQPAVLGFALEQAKNDQPNTGYAMVHPLATITKIILAQLLLSLLGSGSSL